MTYECLFSARDRGWVVEAIDLEKDGGVHRTLFTGPDAELRAREYAEWKQQQLVSSLPSQHRLRRSAA